MVARRKAVSKQNRVVKKIVRPKAKVRVYKRTIIVDKKPAKIDLFMPEPWSRVEKYKKVKVKNEYLVS